MFEEFLEVVVICLILSIDVSVISFNYGMSKIKMPVLSALSIALINLIVSGIGVIISFFISSSSNQSVVDYISIFLLFSLGVFYLIKLFFFKKEEKSMDKNDDKIISPLEAVLFALVLTPDGFCAGLSAGSSYFFILSFLILFLFSTFLSVYLLSFLGYRLSKKIRLNLDWLSPVCLILFSLIKFLILIL